MRPVLRLEANASVQTGCLVVEKTVIKFFYNNQKLLFKLLLVPGFNVC